MTTQPSEPCQALMSDHVAHFWRAISENHVRILIDVRHDHDDGSFHYDSVSFGDDVAKALSASRAVVHAPRAPGEERAVDLLVVMRHGHACPIADEHYAWAVAEITRLRERVADLSRMLDEASYADLRASGGLPEAALPAQAEDPLWQKLRDLFGMNGWHDGFWNGIPTPAQIVTHVEFMADERARLLKETMDTARSVAQAPVPAAEADGMRVKPLQWRDHRPDSFPESAWSAQTPFGFYNIEEVSASDSPAYVVRLHAHHFIADKDSLEDAKAAAQADYDQRIRQALAFEGNGTQSSNDTLDIIERVAKQTADETNKAFFAKHGMASSETQRSVMTSAEPVSEARDSEAREALCRLHAYVLHNYSLAAKNDQHEQFENSLCRMVRKVSELISLSALTTLATGAPVTAEQVAMCIANTRRARWGLPPIDWNFPPFAKDKLAHLEEARAVLDLIKGGA